MPASTRRPRSCPAGNEPHCLTSCASSSDVACAKSGYYGLALNTTEARHLLTEICEQYTEEDKYDPYESLVLFPGAPVSRWGTCGLCKIDPGFVLPASCSLPAGLGH